MNNFNISKSRRLRSTPFTSRIEKQGVKSYTVYNHMLLPTTFSSAQDEYLHLKKDVQIWDVSVQREIEISGKDAHKLVQLMTCRDLSKSKIGKCYYLPLIDSDGGIVNDPLIYKLKDDLWRICIADSDVLLFAKGIASGRNLNVNIFEADIDTLAIQGPKSFKLMEKVFGKKITEMKFFGFDYFEFAGAKHLIARSGWSKQGGYEIYVENTKSGLELYDKLFEEGKEFNVKPGCPNLIERIESALLSYGNDMDNDDNPLECGLDKYVNLDSNINFLGKEKLKEVKKRGITRKLMGAMIEAKEINMSKSIDLLNDKNLKIGELRSATYSPHFKKVIGIAMLEKPYCEVSRTFKISVNGSLFEGKVCDLPFI